MQDRKIYTLSELHSIRADYFPRGKFFCFRGQSDSHWSLVPAIYRGLENIDPPVDEFKDGLWIGEMERDIYREFGRHPKMFVKENWLFTNRWHQLFLAQHYGIPTRLLDWTRNILIAAYFAVSENYDRDGAIWCLNISDFPFPKALGRLARNRGFRLEVLEHCLQTKNLSIFTPLSKPIGAQKPNYLPSDALPSKQSGAPNRNGFLVFVDPPVLEGRIKNQQGIFSVYLSDDEYDFAWNQTEYIKTVETNHSEELLSKIIIPKKQKSVIKNELENSGIDPYTIFPDIEGLIRFIKQEREYLFNCNRMLQRHSGQNL